jgi:hypothetical protein
MPLPGSEMTLASSPEMQIEIVGKFIPSAKSVAGEATPTVDTTPFGTYDERQPCHHASAVALYFPAKCAAPAPNLHFSGSRPGQTAAHMFRRLDRRFHGCAADPLAHGASVEQNGRFLSVVAAGPMRPQSYSQDSMRANLSEMSLSLSNVTGRRAASAPISPTSGSRETLAPSLMACTPQTPC